MKTGWEIKNFDSCIENINYTNKIQRKDFSADGIFPIISQESEFINGYWNDENDLFTVDSPVVIFGDHTKIFKYIDFDFVLGADGVKILKPCNFLLPKYFYYQLQLANLDSLGYARHYRLLKELKIVFPTCLPEQQRIVAILDEAFENIATAKANAQQNLKNARELFESYLQQVFTQRGDGWKLKTLEEISTVFGRGKSRHRPRGDERLLGGKYPVIQTGEVANSNHYITEFTQTYNEMGLAQSKLWPKGTICIAIVGANVAETAILGFESCFPDSVIGIVVNEKLANNEYVEYLLQSFRSILKERGKGTARDNINMGTFESQKFPFPDVNEQNKIVSKINNLAEQTQHLESIYQQKIAALDELKKSLLHKAFSGEL